MILQATLMSMFVFVTFMLLISLLLARDQPHHIEMQRHFILHHHDASSMESLQHVVPWWVAKLGSMGTIEVPQTPAYLRTPHKASEQTVIISVRRGMMEYGARHASSIARHSPHTRVEVWVGSRRSLHPLEERFCNTLRKLPNVHFMFLEDYYQPNDEELLHGDAALYMALALTSSRRCIVLRDNVCLTTSVSHFWDAMDSVDTSMMLFPDVEPQARSSTRSLSRACSRWHMHTFSKDFVANWRQTDACMIVDRLEFWTTIHIAAGLAIHHREVVRVLGSLDNVMKLALGIAGRRSESFFRADAYAPCCSTQAGVNLAGGSIRVSAPERRSGERSDREERRLAFVVVPRSMQKVPTNPLYRMTHCSRFGSRDALHGCVMASEQDIQLHM